MGQGQGKGQYSQIGESFEAESPDGPDLPPEPDNVLNRAQNTFNEIKTQAGQAVLRYKIRCICLNIVNLSKFRFYNCNNFCFTLERKFLLVRN